MIASPLDHVEAYRYFEDGELVVVDGKIAEAGPFGTIRSRYPDSLVTDYPGKLITPGFIDSHTHFPQSEMQGTYGKQLLDWLDEYTFPVEEVFSSMGYTQDIARFFVKELMKNGTTTCAAYATVHPASITTSLSMATEYNMRILAGKVMMNRNVPDYLTDTTCQGELDCRSLIEDWDGKGRNHHVIAPCLAITSTPDQLKSAGRLHTEYPSTYTQTHLSENLEEIEPVLSLCPGRAGYLEVYERTGLLADRSIFGYCAHLTDWEYKRLGETGGIIAHCSTSNLFLRSGLLDMRETNRYGVRTTLATDVGVGIPFSMWYTMGEVYKVQQLNGYPTAALETIYKCTLGPVRALLSDDRIGGSLPGRETDLIVVDHAATSVQKLRMEYFRSRDRWMIENKPFGLQTLGNDRNTVCICVAGKRVHGSDSCDHQEAGM